MAGIAVFVPTVGNGASYGDMRSFAGANSQGRVGALLKPACEGASKHLKLVNSSNFASSGVSFRPSSFQRRCLQSQVHLGEEAAEKEEDEVRGGEGNNEGREEQDPQDVSAKDEDFNTKANNMLRDAILKFAEEDLEEASKKYDMEEELFSEIDFAQINAFTDRPFGGNPAAVCYLPLKRHDRWMQLVAREFNLSETAFLRKRSSSKNKPSVQKKDEKDPTVDEFDLRWFTPKVEVDLCGHATLASAHLLFSSGIANSDTILFHTRSGLLKARKVSGYDDDMGASTKTGSDDFDRSKKRPIGVGVVELDFPIGLSSKCSDAEVDVLREALGGVQILWAGHTTLGDYLVEVASHKEIEDLQPEFPKMLNFSGRGGVIVTSCAGKDTGFDFISRFFCPKAGIFEDPVTGSAHCALAPYWAERLQKTTLKAFQASERGGSITVHVEKDEGRVYLQGSAVLVMAGVLLNTMLIDQ